MPRRSANRVCWTASLILPKCPDEVTWACDLARGGIQGLLQCFELSCCVSVELSMAGQDGEGLSTGGLDGTEAARIVAVRSNAILSLDKAETIAARRLRELAIRLATMMRKRPRTVCHLTPTATFANAWPSAWRRSETDAPRRSRPTPFPYAVSDALSLSALGLSMPLLAGPVARPRTQDRCCEVDGAPAKPSLRRPMPRIRTSIRRGPAAGR